jgi:uncharacterized YigZ family protein
MSQGYPVPSKTLEREIERRKSRFIAHAGRVGTREEAMAFLQSVRDRYPDARHHCWAYLVGDPETATSAAMNDDGEPSGTAGKPILNVIQHKGIGDVMVVVARYFGGVKLGAGGLVRAYAGATEAVLSELPVAARVPLETVRMDMDFAHEQAVRHWAGERDAEVLAIDYGEGVTMRLRLPAEQCDELKSFCAANGIVWRR